MIEGIRAFFLIFIAEMGDKSQILAITFAAQYGLKTVLLGIFIGIFLNHGLAIVLGRYISKFISMDSIQIIAGITFIVFGILTLDEDEIEEDKEKKGLGSIMAIAMAFFIGELGDKTQLATMTLAAECNYPLLILCGTTLGMIATSTVAIFVGNKVGKKIPDTFIKIISSWIFILFGTFKLYKCLPRQLLNSVYAWFYVIIIISIQSKLAINLILTKMNVKNK